MKYEKYRIVKDFGKFYVEVPKLFWTWQRLGRNVYKEVGPQTFSTYKYYEFKTYKGAEEFAKDNKYEVRYIS